MNRYFLLIALLQLWSDIAPVSPLTTWLPLFVIFGVSALREGLDDYARYRTDKQFNEAAVRVVRAGHWADAQSQDLRVGDLVQVYDGQTFPADLVLVASSDVDEGVCYVQTANIDGETDLKPKRVPRSLRPTAPASSAGGSSGAGSSASWSGSGAVGPDDVFPITGLTSAAQFRGVVEAGAPDDNVHEFRGNMRVSTSASASESLSQQQFLLQGTQLRNTSWIVGLAVYTGNETKLSMNKHAPPTKWTRIDQLINRTTIVIFVAQIVFALVFGITGTVTNRTSGVTGMWYLYVPDDGWPWWQFIIVPLRFLLLCSAMIPISLKVTIDIVKYLYAMFVGWDAQMYDERTDTPAHCANSEVAEDLACVKYVFTDKTGTLTENEMLLRRCSIGGQLYDAGDRDESPGASARGSSEFDSSGARPRSLDAPRGTLALAHMQRSALGNAVRAGDPAAVHFLRALVLCSTVGVQHSDADSAGASSAPSAAPTYASTSPDELALVEAAAVLGVRLAERRGSSITLRLPDGSTEEWETLFELPFSSARRRMSVIVRLVRSAPPPSSGTSASGSAGAGVEGGARPTHSRRVSSGSGVPGAPGVGRTTSPSPSGLSATVLVLSKGADDVLVPRMAARMPAASQSGSASTASSLAGAGSGPSSVDGGGRVRTDSGAAAVSDAPLLTTTERHLDEFARTGLRTLLVGERRLRERECEHLLHELHEASVTIAEREERMQAAFDLVEQRLRVLGATAIEDRLQDGVADTLETLRRAGIGVWMLTGDKFGTAVQIAVSCGLAPAGVLDEHSSTPLVAIRGTTEAQSVAALQAAHDQVVRQGARRLTVAIEGSALQWLMQGQQLESLRTLLMSAHAVICCRVSPSQKASIVLLVKAPRQVTLAIGDGGNDVGMIQAADVGVGLTGKEGMQASRAADYSFARFRFLQRLLLVHGRAAYYRTSVIAQYSFYKSIFICLIQLCFATVSHWSGASLFNSFALMLYNVAFTGVPIVFYVLDRDVDDDVLARNPQLLRACQEGRGLNARTLAGWAGRAVYHAVVVVAFVFLAYNVHYAHALSGLDADQVAVSMVAYTIAIFLQSVVLGLETHSFTWLNVVAVAGLPVVYIIVMLVSQTIMDFGFFMVFNHLFGDAVFWFTLISALWVCAAPLIGAKVYSLLRNPEERYVIMMRLRRQKEYAGDDHEEIGAAATLVRGGGAPILGSDRRYDSSSIN